MATIKGNSKNNVLHGTAAPDTILGGAGNDTIFGAPGDIKIDGGSGFDTLDLAQATSGVYYREFGAQLKYGLEGPQTTKVYNIERVIGTRYDDLLFGGAGADTIVGGGGHDHVSGGAGDDTLVGDYLPGYAHSESGAEAFDIFEFELNDSGKDRILDFQYGIDKLFFVGVPQPTQFATSGNDLVVSWANGTVTLLGLGWVSDYSQLTTLSHDGLTVG